ncbi:c-type heme family protein [Muriicola marianensis]|uniref:Cytochrome c domain-containing protein n=1 Tax=Muriicola marianensis TaxID=1324801 RepID=A0ABQ1R4X9_9FLAO|nr:DUF3365 domain-containing protein [Muriicola marianensis]GGD58382.1 hypothetical protein GCM10011361_25910 [Muriicola marianensis]
MRIWILLLSAGILFSCKDGKKNELVPVEEAARLEMEQSRAYGKQIVERECYICHDPSSTEMSMIAPPMVAVRSHYMDKRTSREEFTQSLTNWLNDPQPEKVKMKGAFKRFGIMPYQPYSVDDIQDIAAYLYDSELPQPDWYEEHRRNRHGKGMDQAMDQGDEEEDTPYFPNAAFYLEKGSEIAGLAQGVLGKNLVGAIDEKGTSGAISFCKIRATGLTDSVGIMNNAIIKRVSDKPRNPQNRATAEETGYIIAFRKQLENQAENKGRIIPIVKETGEDEVLYYSPITTNSMCLQCHGKRETDIQEPVLTTLKELYPMDEATGYEAGQIRGMWKIQFVKETQ